MLDIRRRTRAVLVGVCFVLLGLLAWSCGSSSKGADGGSDSGAPYLTSLAVSGAGVLTPVFSSSVHDYYVSCAAETNSLSVSMTASSGDVSLLVDPASLSPTSKSAPMQTVAVTVKPNDAIVAVAENPATKAEVQYWVRCLPPDFPPIVATRHSGSGTLQPGYYLAGTLLSVGGFTGYAMILDQNGVPVWYFAQPDGRPVLDVDEVVPGSISFSFQAAATNPVNSTPDTPFTVVNPSSPSQTTTLGPMDYHTDNHDLQRTPDGNYVVIAYLDTPGIDLTGLTCANGAEAGCNGNALGPNSTIQDCAIVKFDSSGHEQFSWLASKHFDPANVTTYIDTGYGQKIYDVFHCNSVDVDPSNGNYLVSGRQMDSVFYVDGTSGDVLWKLGGKPHSKDPGTVFVSIPTPKDAFHQQHDARLLKGWAPGCHGGTGQVSVFDDETAPTGSGNARGAVYDVVVGGSGATGCASGAPDGGAPPSGTAKLVLSYPGMAESQLGGSVRFYEDGSRVVSWGLTTPPTNQLLTEYDDHGNDLLDLDFLSVHSSICDTYRGLKVPLSAFDIDTLRKTAGQ
jgi:hypothetical protein